MADVAASVPAEAVAVAPVASAHAAGVAAAGVAAAGVPDRFGYTTLVWAVKRIATFPSRFIARIRLLDQLLEENAERQAASIAARVEADRAIEHGTRLGPGPSAMPGPWSFFLSGYGIGIFVMTYLVTKIHSVVVPSHRSHRSHSPSRSSFWPLLPLDTHSTLSRTLVRLPTLYFLERTLLVWTVVLLQTAGLYPSWQKLQHLGRWVQSIPTEDLHWNTFLVVCATLLVSAFTNSLESSGSRRTSPFNLMGYAFLLHIYSSPLTHTNKGEGFASRPDKHAVITIIMPLLQLTLLHFLGVKKTWSRYRLVPTSFCALTSLFHFHYVLWFSSSSYPVVTFLPSVLESLLVVLVGTTTIISALAQLATEGAITRPLLGHSALLPSWDEDFAVALLRAGTASLDATSVAGLGNEVGTVSAPTEGGLVEIDRTGVTRVAGDRAAADGAPRNGFANEIKRVVPAAVERDVWFDSVLYREAITYGFSLWRVVKALALWPLQRFRHPWSASVLLQPRIVAPNVTVSPPMDDEEEELDVYTRFLRGESLSDDSDDEFVPSPSTPTRARSMSVFSGFDSRETTPTPGYDGSPEAVDAAGLFAEHLGGASSAVQAPLLLAHLTANGNSPLTRRRYSHMLTLPPTGAGPTQPLVHPGDETEADWEQFVYERRSRAHAVDTDDLLRRQTCVVCATEPRSVILWPCRCLALCDDCRANLASRASANKHSCPCCRQSVEGFSKIYIP